MKNLASQLIIAGINPDKSFTNKSLKVFEKFVRAMEGKYFVGTNNGTNNNGETVRFKISYIYSRGMVFYFESEDKSSYRVIIHASDINWFKCKRKSGAWIEGVGAII